MVSSDAAISCGTSTPHPSKKEKMLRNKKKVNAFQAISADITWMNKKNVLEMVSVSIN